MRMEVLHSSFNLLFMSLRFVDTCRYIWIKEIGGETDWTVQQMLFIKT